MMSEDPAVSRFREYLRIKSVSSLNPTECQNYDVCIKYLQNYASELGLECKVIEVLKEPYRGVVIMTLPGTEPKLPSILLNSHYDVVPVFEEFWKYEPFSAYKDEKGDIYARGTQDMKCVTIQYLEAIRRLKKEGKTFTRTLHLSFVPDEEVTGKLGMKLFVETEAFADLNVGLALDEGLANPTDEFTVFYGERAIWWLKVVCSGDPGHGSRFIENNAGEKVRKVINSFLSYRDEQEKRLKENSELRLGDVTTVNLTMLEGGVQPNVVPSDLSATFDMRITPDDMEGFEERVNTWCREAGDGISLQYVQQYKGNMVSPIADDNPWWKSFLQACSEKKMKIQKEIFPAATDSRFLRKRGLPAIGFSPMNQTPIKLHDHNEVLNEDVFLRGIDIYCHIISALANVPAS